MNKPQKENTSIAKKVILYVVISGLLVAIAGTFLSLRRDYTKFKKNLESSFKNVEKTYLETLATSLYSEDNEQVGNILKGILGTPDFIYVQISGVEEEEKEIKFKVGEIKGEANLSHSADILLPKEERDEDEEEIEVIGRLKMVASLKGITEKMREQVLVFAIIQGTQFFLITLCIYYVFRKFVSRHLQKMASYASSFNLSELDRDDLALDREEQKRSDELEKVVDSFNTMKKNLKISHEQLKDYAENLEEKVREATREIEEEKNKVSNLLNNMQQAIFCVNADWSVIPPVSSYSSICFEKDIMGQDIFKTLYKDIDRDSEEYANINSAFSVIFGSDDLQYEMIEDHLISKLNFKVDIGDNKPKDKIFNISYTPLWDESGLLDKIMFNVEDVTEKEKLELKIKEEKKSNQKNISIITEMANAELDDVELFLSNSRKLIDETMDLAKNDEKRNTGMQNIFRFLHTLKGNARAFNFDSISSLTHVTESQVKDITESNGESLERQDVEPLIDNLYFLRQELNDYGKLAKKVFKIENAYEKKLLKETQNYITDLDNLICEKITSHEIDMISSETQKSRKLIFSEIISRGIEDDVILKLKRTCHSLRGCLRSVSSLNSISHDVKTFENSFSLLDNLEISKLNEFSENFIDPFISVKDKVKNIFMQSDLSKPLSYDKEEWSEFFVSVYKLSLEVMSLRDAYKGSKEKVDIRAFLYNMAVVLENTKKMELIFISKTLSDFSDKVQSYGEDINWDEELFIFNEVFRYISLISYLDFSKIKNPQARNELYKEVEELIKYSKENEEDKVKSRIFDLNHELIIHIVLEKLVKEKINLFKFFKDVEGWIGGESPYSEGKGLVDFFLYPDGKTTNLSAIRVELKTARITNNLPERIVSLSKDGDPTAMVLTGFFLGKKYYYYIKLIDFYLLLNGFFVEKQGDHKVKKIETWPVVMRNIKKLEKIIEGGDIQEIRRAVLRLKDIPILPQISKFRTMVYDIALKLSKNVDFELDGEEVSLNKEAYNILQDALVHILRNCLDHGIERPGERQNLGKKPKGLIKLTCHEKPENDTIELIIQDDGKGIDPERIGKKAIEKGLIGQDELKGLSKESILELIFLPNFSQKDGVDELSGRGIGMDIVKENVTKLGGNVKIESELGKGTKLTINIKGTG